MNKIMLIPVLGVASLVFADYPVLEGSAWGGAGGNFGLETDGGVISFLASIGQSQGGITDLEDGVTVVRSGFWAEPEEVIPVAVQTVPPSMTPNIRVKVAGFSVLVDLDLVKVCAVTIRILGVDGRTLRSQYHPQQAAGHTHLDIQLTGLTATVAFIAIEAGSTGTIQQIHTFKQ